MSTQCLNRPSIRGFGVNVQLLGYNRDVCVALLIQVKLIYLQAQYYGMHKGFLSLILLLSVVDLQS